MNSTDVKLHAGLIRSIRSLLNHWEEWVLNNSPELGKVEENGDPLKHVQQVKNTQTRPNGAPR